MSESELRSSRGLWILAAIAALALHLGGAALALANLRAGDGDEGLGAAGAEFAVELASSEAQPTDKPTGPSDSEAQEERPELPQQKAETQETQLPQDRPQQVEDPDRIVAEHQAKKEQDDDPKLAAVETPAMEAQQKQIDMVRQTFEDATREADKALAPVVGIGKDILKLTEDWNRKISAHIKLHQVNPEGKENNNQAVKVTFTLNRRGNVLSADVVQSSGDPAYDAAAISMIRKSDPFEPPPAKLTEDRFERTIEIKFTPPDAKKKKKTAQRQ
ncbi:energy transducer TonB [Bradyrhizobium sp. GCM10027634]|uniref:energy transducer TonB n=1 Tax=unclassified Bradyrhizobium TaxID=2631580 RepID=UPI00188D3F80|nr:MULTISPECIES: TonB family protein [unclassified Bradyrhizobium]MDN5001604.1 TonB family protein [Bradyrhizobium sp. WYCCWR 12677]QOZ46060.1 energy transducer TonB [Bradyrhizobium sp. CCBAU 53340]